MNCEEAREARLDQAAGPLSAERTAALEAHLKECDACRAFEAEIDSLEERITDTLQSAADVDVARRFKPRVRWAPLAAAALVALKLGWWLAQPRVAGPGAVLEGPRAFALERASVSLADASRARVEGPRFVRLEKGRAHFRVEPGSFQVETDVGRVSVLGTEFTVEVKEDVLNRNKTALPASVLVVGVVSGAVLLEMNDGQKATVKAGETAVATARAPITVLSAAEQAQKQAEAEKKIATLEAALARSQAHETELAKKLEATASTASASATEKAKPAAGSGSASASAEPTEDEKVLKLVKTFDWKASVKALMTVMRAQAKGQNVNPDLYVTVSKMNVLVGEISKARGYSSPFQAYGDPAVREEFVPAWIDALGANLDDQQTAALKQHVREIAKQRQGSDADTYLGAIRAKLESNFEREKFLGTLLRPEQQQAIDATVGDDVWFGMQQSLSSHRSSTLDGLVENVLGHWKRSFDLSPQSVEAARSIARKLAEEQAALAPPPDDGSLDVGARRAASAQRWIALLGAQERAEKELASLTVLTDAERARANEGSNKILELQLKK